MFHYKLFVLAVIALAVSVTAVPPRGVNSIPNYGIKTKSNLEKTQQQISVLKPENDKPVLEMFPHAVLYGGTCGGTIISPTWIITAAHCTLDLAFYVRAGTNDTEDSQGGVMHGIKRRVIHPLFTVGPYWVSARDYNLQQVGAHYDFLLVELDDPLPLNGVTIKAATLNDDLYLPTGLRAGFAGFGTNEFGGTMSNELHARKLVIKSDDDCAKMKEYSSQDMLCTEGRFPRYDSACSGDSGSGLVDEQGRLLGVLSWVEKDAVECRNGNLMVFGKIASVRDWIKNVTGI